MSTLTELFVEGPQKKQNVNIQKERELEDEEEDVVVVVVNSEIAKNNVMAEDGDSRDSGISVTSLPPPPPLPSSECLDFSKIESSRLALTDCSNFVPKIVIPRNSSVSSSRSSSLYNCDTPTGRKRRSIFSEDLDQSQYEPRNRTVEFLTRKRSSTSMSPSTSLMDRKRSRNLSIVAPQSDRICRYNQVFPNNNVANPFDDEEDDDDVFMKSNQEELRILDEFVAPAPRCASLWTVAPPMIVERQTSDTSANGSFNEKVPKGIQRAMSVGVIDTDLPTILDVQYSLPGVDNPQKPSQAFRSISPETLLLEFKRLGDNFDKVYIIVDCRFPFEYNGGHVRGAVNLFTHDKILPTFFPEDEIFDEAPIGKRIPIFYCEYSQKRGPTMAQAVRSIDRVRNELRYPHVEYPEMYLLDYGYKSLWNSVECRQICEPCAYIPMDNHKFMSEFKSARLERHHSIASLKPNGETGEQEGKKSRRTRSAIRRNNSVMSMQSKFSLSSQYLNSASSQSFESDFSVNSEVRTHKYSSAFDLQSIGGSSEADIDVALSSSRAITTTTSSSTVISNASSVESLVDIESSHVVQLGMKVTTPDFGILHLESAPTTPSGSATIQGDIPSALDFSSISDTD